eukprot:m51a1_g2791 hypothetical protein (223) ;mRNA; r:60411-61231
MSLPQSSATVAQRKSSLRREMKSRRLELAPAAARDQSAALCAALERLLFGGGPAPRAVASFCSTPGEPDLSALHSACWARGCPVLLPRVLKAGQLSWHALPTAEHARWLRPGAYGITEPDPSALPELAGGIPDGAAVVVPGVAFSRDGRRLGRGAGFYDRALAGGRERRGLWAVGAGFACQLVDDVPVDDHDAPLDAVVAGPDVFVLRDRASLQPSSGAQRP